MSSGRPQPAVASARNTACPASYLTVPGNASGPRVNPTISIPADGDPGQAPTFNGYKLAFDEVALKQRVACLADGVQAKAWALVNVNAGTVTVTVGSNVPGSAIQSGHFRVSYPDALASLNQAAVGTPL